MMNLCMIGSTSALGGLLFGYDTGVISGPLLFIRKVMSQSPKMLGVVVAVALAGAATGAAMAVCL
ncbi:MAG: MFS transporter [Proteobacteria bacterium]|nr:MFS transporter [Pseudomonadota bacterium]